MIEFKILDSIAETSGKNEKREILEKNKDNKELAELLNASLNFFRKFHIHKFDMPEPIEINQSQNMHHEFMTLLGLLENRIFTGNDAKDAVEKFFVKCNSEQQQWYCRVLQKDLKAGISVDTAAKYFDIPTFDVMLATDGKKCKNMNEIISKGVYASPKLDGYRCLAVITGGSVTLYSRNGSIYKNFPSIEKALLNIQLENALLHNKEDWSIVLDGEIMSDDFQSMQQSAFASTRGTTVGDVKFHVFDVLILDEWNTGKFKDIKSKRLKLLKSLSEDFKETNITLVDQELVKSLERVYELERNYMALGYEGVMVVPDIPYYKGRKSNKLMKFKTMLSQDCEIIGFYEGKTGTRHEGRMGGLVLKQENGLECECGSGFSDSDRDYMWQAQSEFLGRKVEIKYQELTNHSIMRFPIFMRFRNDK